MKKTILLDVDETVVSLVKDWELWYLNKTGIEMKFKNQDDLEEAMLNHRLDPLRFWEKNDIYDNAIPLPGAQEFINNYKHKYNFIFCSNCFPGHIESKRSFLDRYFGPVPFIDTYYKQYINCDIAIDDRHHFLKVIKDKQPNTEVIQIKAKYNNEHEGISFMDWDDISIHLGN